jgi:hypothetical protein
MSADETSFWEQFVAEDALNKAADTPQATQNSIAGPEELAFWGQFEQEAPKRSIGSRALRAPVSALHGAAQAAQDIFGFSPTLAGAERSMKGQEERAPTLYPETALEKGLSRAARSATSTAALGGGRKLAGLAASGAFAAQGVEEAGGGPVLQLVAELLPIAAQPIVSGTLVASKASKPFVEGAKRLGMTSKEIAPLVRGGTAENLSKSFLAKPSTRNKIVQETRGGVTRALETADEAVAKIGNLPEDLRTSLLDKWSELTTKVATGVGEFPGDQAAAKFLREEMGQIGKKRLTGQDLGKLYRSINQRPIIRDSEVGRMAKEQILETLKKANPSAGADFELGNQIYSRLKIIEGGPRHAGENLNKAELYGLVRGLADPKKGSVSAISAFGSHIVLRSAFTHVVSGPRGHRVVQKMFSALADGKPAVAQAAARKLDEMVNEQIEAQGGPGVSISNPTQAAGLGLFHRSKGRLPTP